MLTMSRLLVAGLLIASARAQPPPPPPPPLVLTVRALDAEPIVSGEAIAWTPFEVNTNRPVQAIHVDAQAPPGVRVETIAPLLAGQTRPRVTITVPDKFDGQQVSVRFVLRPAEEHAAADLASVTGEHYAGGHWLGTFATYLMTRRGIRM